MQLLWKSGLVTLEGADDFKRFGIVIEAPPSRRVVVEQGFRGIARFADVATAWVSHDGLCRLTQRASDADWQAALQAMIDKARPHGWVDEASGDIQAHIVWQADAAG